MSGQSAAALRKQPAASPLVKRVFSWGRYPKTAHQYLHRPAWNDQVPEILEAAAPGSLLPYGLGRSYGDSCLNGGRGLIDCCRLNRILGFDESTGMLRCESGVSLDDIIRVFLPNGWFLPVTPGTRFVTVGEQSPMMFMARIITALAPSALMSARSACIARTTVW